MKEDPENLDRLLHERLRALPDPPAPRDLIPKVLQRIATAPPPPWWTLPWLEWPRPLQILSSAGLAALLGAIFLLRAGLISLFHASSRWLQNAPGFVHQTVTAAQTLWKVFEHMMVLLQFPWLTEAAVVLIALYFCILGVGVVFYRVLASQPIAIE